MKHLRKYTDVVTVRLVMERQIPSAQNTSSKKAAAFIKDFCLDAPVEMFSAILLKVGNQATKFSIAIGGTLNSSLIHPTQIFQQAILADAAGVIPIHNHPSGSLEPSGEDIPVPRQIVESRIIHGIPVHDHVIITPDGSYDSITEKGLL